MKSSLGFNKEEFEILKKLNTPVKIQDFLDKLPINFEEKGDTCMSPRLVLRNKKAHCIEGAFLAAAALMIKGEKPLLLDLKSADHDFDHVVALFKRNGNWGAISKTNHAVLRYREPVYKTMRELAMSYFHEYFTDDGKKTKRSFSEPFDLRQFNNHGWLTSEKNLWYISKSLDDSPHIPILTKSTLAGLRKADKVEIEAGKIVQFRK